MGASVEQPPHPIQPPHSVLPVLGGKSSLAAVTGAGGIGAERSEWCHPLLPGVPCRGGEGAGQVLGQGAGTFLLRICVGWGTLLQLPPFLTSTFWRGAPTVHGSCPAENEPTCDGPGGETAAGRRLVCVPRFPKMLVGLPRASWPPGPPRPVLMAEDVPGGRARGSCRCGVRLSEHPQRGAGARQGAPRVWGGPVPSRAPPPRP